MLYETKLMSFSEAQLFEQWFNGIIGTECEFNMINQDIEKVYFVCADLTQTEVDLLRIWENKRRI